MLRGWLPNGQGSEQKIKEREESKGRILGSDLRERKSRERVRVCFQKKRKVVYIQKLKPQSN